MLSCCLVIPRDSPRDLTPVGRPLTSSVQLAETRIEGWYPPSRGTLRPRAPAHTYSPSPEAQARLLRQLLTHAAHLHRSRLHPGHRAAAHHPVPRQARLGPVRWPSPAAAMPSCRAAPDRASPCPLIRRLPPSAQKTLIGWADTFVAAVQPLRDAMQEHLWDRIGWKVKPTKPKLPPAAKDGMDGGGAAGDDIKALKAQLGKVVGIHSIEEWEAAMELSREVPVVVDFTAVWCVRSRHLATPRHASHLHVSPGPWSCVPQVRAVPEDRALLRRAERQAHGRPLHQSRRGRVGRGAGRGGRHGDADVPGVQGGLEGGHGHGREQRQARGDGEEGRRCVTGRVRKAVCVLCLA